MTSAPAEAGKSIKNAAGKFEKLIVLAFLNSIDQIRRILPAGSGEEKLFIVLTTKFVRKYI